MSVAFLAEVQKIKRLAPLTDADIARAVGVGATTVAAWRTGRQTPRGPRAARLVELSALVERLADVMQPDYIPVWLIRPVTRLGHRAPADVLASGRYDEVSGVVGDIEHSMFS